MDFNIATSQTSDTPHPMSIHYLVMPNHLLFPDFTLLEDISPSSLPDLLSIIKGVNEMLLEGGPVGIGYNRIAYNDRWGVVGERELSWVYDQAFKYNRFDGIFFSPQQMISLSQNRPTPKADP